MDRKTNKNLKKYSQDLRKNQTKEERHLWYDFLSTYPVKFVRQKVLGKYIADFYCAKAQLIVELDGTQHFLDDGLNYDKERDLYLKQYKLKIIRIANDKINNNFRAVCEYIDSIIKKHWNKLKFVN